MNTTDISWIEELIKNKTMAWSVYLTIIYLLAEHGPQDFVDNISAKEVVQNRLIRYYYANHPFGRYFIGKSEEFYKAFQAGKEFIEKLFKHDIISRASERKAFLEKIESQYFDIFTNACKEFIKPSAIPNDLASKAIELLKMIHSMEFPFRTTGKGTVIFNDLFSCGICVERLGLSRRDLDRLLRALIKSGIVIRLGLNYVIPAPCTTNEIIGLIAIYANDVKNANLGANKPSGSATNSIREAIEKIIKRGLPYMVALMSYLYFEHLYWVERGKCIRGSGQCLEPYIMKDKEENVKYTLLIAFEEKFAEEVFAELEERIHKRLTQMFTHKKLKSVKSITRQTLTLLKKKSG